MVTVSGWAMPPMYIPFFERSPNFTPPVTTPQLHGVLQALDPQGFCLVANASAKLQIFGWHGFCPGKMENSKPQEGESGGILF